MSQILLVSTKQDKARELRHQGFTIKINVERDEDEERGVRYCAVPMFFFGRQELLC
jgi:hypothetical protein